MMKIFLAIFLAPTLAFFLGYYVGRQPHKPTHEQAWQYSCEISDAWARGWHDCRKAYERQHTALTNDAITNFIITVYK